MLLLLLACTRTLPETKLDSGAGWTGHETGSPETGDGETGETGGPFVMPDIALTLDEDVVTMVDVAWDPTGAASSWVEYSLDGKAWLTAPTIDDGSAVLLGIPSLTAVTARLAVQVGSAIEYSTEASITTGAIPDIVPLPTIDAWEESLAYPADFVMISVASGNYTFQGPYIIEIFDRQGQVVWYYEVPDYMFTFYPTVSLDGTHIWYESDNIMGTGFASPSITRRTLDGRWSTTLDVPDMGQAASEGPDGSFFYEQRSSSGYGIERVDAKGDRSVVWNCAAWMAEHDTPIYMCYMNATQWSEAHGSVLASMFYSNTVFEIDVASGEPIRQMGQLTVGEPWTFSPSDSVFSYQHYVNWIDEDTLLVSTHVDGTRGVQIAAEYDVDDDTKTLTRTWAYESTDRWATQLGEATRLPNGNTVQGYGQDGAVREVTPDQQTAWEAHWDKNREGYRVVGHASFISDLYALNAGPE